MRMIKVFSLMVGALLSVEAMAQQVPSTVDSSPSVRPIPDHDILFKKTVWRKIDLREKQNKPMFSENRQITKIIIDAVKSGELIAYRSDTLATPITQEEFVQRMTPSGSQEMTPEDEIFKTQPDDDPWGAVVSNNAEPVAPVSMEYFPKDLYLLELKEDLIFDKKRSRMYHDIQSISIKVPSTLSAKGFEEHVASFKMSDLARLFKNNPEAAIWYNPRNEAQHKNLAEAFELWLFSSYITKISNPGNQGLGDIYGPGQKSLLAAQEAAEALIEYEYSLWSY
ncbi:type IX secretion system ring subunit PorN/GldN [Pontibacter beigongshangensis]|uniref:type IX secretion system ring protein PorN/GldN n=1 Tax=Pontibacter beigongshangensis TaxID=2574733 RepID=UPI00165012DB|nr:gliding motility protein GldN [Pontibacter beigongshangensis]